MCVKERIAKRIKRWRNKEKEDGKENEFCKMMTLASVIGRMFVCAYVILYKELEHVWDAR